MARRIGPAAGVTLGTDGNMTVVVLGNIYVESVVDGDVQLRVGMEGVARDTNDSNNISAAWRLCSVLNLSRG